MKRLRKIVKDLKLKQSKKETSIIAKEVCTMLEKEGFEPNERSVHSMLNQLEVGNTRT